MTRELRCQVCVIGSGAGGSAAAATLAAAGRDVVLLEAGPHHDPSTFDQRETTMMPRLFEDGGLTATSDQSMAVMSGRGLGGSTVHNTGLAVPAPRPVLERWAAGGGLPLGVEGFEAAQGEVMRRLGARVVDDDEINANNRVLADGARARGLEFIIARHNRERCSGCGYCMIGCAYNKKRNALFAWLEGAVANGLRIVVDAPVDRILERGDTTLVRGRDLQVQAEEVFIAASALRTPLLLRRSGLGLRSVGTNLRLHPFAPVAALFDDRIAAWRGVPQSVLVTGDARFFHGGRGGWILMAGAAGPAATAAFVPGHGRDVAQLMGRYERLAFGGVLLHDEGCSSVRGRRDGRPAVKSWPRGEDRDGLVAGIRSLAELYFAAGARQVFLPFTRRPRVNSPADLDGLERLPFRPYDVTLSSVHPQASVPMGAGRDAPVLPDGRVRGARRVRVADGSLFPGSVGVPPQVAIMTYGMLVAQVMLAEGSS
jgi:choline dehydrogenase-like flavoprotein